MASVEPHFSIFEPMERCFSKALKPFSGWIKLLGILLAVGTMSACKSEPPQATIVRVDKKMPLAEWPDSLYIAGLDSILALEPIKKQDKNKPSIAMNTFKAPSFALPASVTGKKDNSQKRADRPGKSTGEKLPGTTAKNVDTSAEAFADKFTTALSKLQSDPSNASLYKVVESKDGEDLFKLLRRTYGAGVLGLPRFYVLSALQSVNAGVMLEHLNAGDKVRVPRI